MEQQELDIRKLLLFILILILLFSFFEIRARNMYSTETDLSCQYESFGKIKDKIEVLFLGSSHIEKAVNPQFIKRKSFNLAFSGQDFYYDDEIIKKFIDEMPNLKAVVLDLSYHSFTSERTTGFMIKEYFRVLGILPKIKYIPKVIANASIFYCHQNTFIEDFLNEKKPVPYYIIDINTVDVSQLKKNCLLSNGYRYSYNSLLKKRLLLNAEIRAKLHGALKGKEKIFEENKKYLEEMIESISSRNLKIIMLTPPSTTYYQEDFDPEFLTVFRNRVKNILDTYPTITYYDFSNMKELEDGDFLDSDHLNYQGSKKFSLLLDSLLNKELSSQKNAFLQHRTF